MITLRPDSMLTNADWPKRTNDILDLPERSASAAFEAEPCPEHGEFACHSAACRPPGSGGTGGSSPGFNPPNGADMTQRMAEKLAYWKHFGRSQPEFRGWADIEGMAKAWHDVLPENPRVRVRVPSSALESIARDGLLTQHDTGTSRGAFDPERRLNAEQWMFTNRDANPRYGYVLTKHGQDTGAAWVYGDVALELKPSVHDRVTVTSEDSLGDGRVTSMMAPVPMNEIRTASDERLWGASRSRVTSDYKAFEAQIHGTVTAADVARVITNNPLAADRARLLFPGAEIVLLETDEFSTVTIGFVAGAFVASCEAHGEFACRSAACRPPTSGGTGGSLPGPGNGNGSRVGGTPGPYGQPRTVDAVKKLFESEVGDISAQSDRVTAKIRSAARVSQRMVEDPEFVEWTKEVFDDTYSRTQTPDGSGIRRAIANRIIREAGMARDETKTLLDAVRELKHLDESPEKFLADRVAAEFITEWSTTSSDHSPPAVAAQFAAAKLHGVSDSALRSRSDMEPDIISAADAMLEGDGKVLSAFARAEYAATQAFFEDNGITSVTVFRGVVLDSKSPVAQADKKAEVNLESQPLSSWSSSAGEAYGFAADTTYEGAGKPRRIVLSMELPVSAIQSTPLSGRGCLPELEIVAIGFPSSATIVESFR